MLNCTVEPVLLNYIVCTKHLTLQKNRCCNRYLRFFMSLLDLEILCAVLMKDRTAIKACKSCFIVIALYVKRIH